jgi:hypothetical protein
MTGPTREPNPWAYSETRTVARPRKLSRRTLAVSGVGVAVLVLLVVALVAWLAWPRSAPLNQADAPRESRPLLSAKPPTTILNAIDFDSLYPPGYTEYDPAKRDPNSESSYDPDRDYETTSEPPGCTFEDDPINQAEYDYDNEDPEKYQNSKIMRLMYPVDDPGGNDKSQAGGTGFSLVIYPSPDPASLDFARDWYQRCNGAKTTTTVTKHGQFVTKETDTVDKVVIDAPDSAADDSFALTRSDRAICDFYGLVRGMIVNVTCSPAQRDTGAQLWRNVVVGLQAV